MAGSPPLVEVRALTVSLDGATVLDAIDLELAPGRIHAFIGPNGGGKTTLLRTLLGNMPFRGEVLFHWRGAGSIGYAPQSFGADRTLPLTVLDFFALTRGRRPAWLGPSRAVRRAALEALERAGVAGLAHRPLAGLSGGERRRVLLAQAVIGAPELLLLDEPTSEVDRHGADLVESILVDLRARGSTILCATHDLEGVRRIADDVWCLGRNLRFHGPPSEALTLERLLEAFRPGVEA